METRIPPQSQRYLTPVPSPNPREQSADFQNPTQHGHFLPVPVPNLPSCWRIFLNPTQSAPLLATSLCLQSRSTPAGHRFSKTRLTIENPSLFPNHVNSSRIFQNPTQYRSFLPVPVSNPPYQRQRSNISHSQSQPTREVNRFLSTPGLVWTTHPGWSQLRQESANSSNPCLDISSFPRPSPKAPHQSAEFPQPTPATAVGVAQVRYPGHKHPRTPRNQVWPTQHKHTTPTKSEVFARNARKTPAHPWSAPLEPRCWMPPTRQEKGRQKMRPSSQLQRRRLYIQHRSHSSHRGRLGLLTYGRTLVVILRDFFRKFHFAFCFSTSERTMNAPDTINIT